MTDAPPKIEPDWKVLNSFTENYCHCSPLPECEAGPSEGLANIHARWSVHHRRKARAFKGLSWRAAATRMGFLAPRHRQFAGAIVAAE